MHQACLCKVRQSLVSDFQLCTFQQPLHQQIPFSSRSSVHFGPCHDERLLRDSRSAQEYISPSAQTEWPCRGSHSVNAGSWYCSAAFRSHSSSRQCTPFGRSEGRCAPPARMQMLQRSLDTTCNAFSYIKTVKGIEEPDQAEMYMVCNAVKSAAGAVFKSGSAGSLRGGIQRDGKFTSPLNQHWLMRTCLSWKLEARLKMVARL